MGDNAAVVQALYEAFRRGDIDAILGMVDPEVEWSASRSLPYGGPYERREGLLAFFQGIARAWRALTIEVEAMGEIGPGLVASVFRASGSLRGHGEASFEAVQVFTVEGGLITRVREYVDLDEPLGEPRA
jgi:ketosteroid isomerase-like protein